MAISSWAIEWLRWHSCEDKNLPLLNACLSLVVWFGTLFELDHRFPTQPFWIGTLFELSHRFPTQPFPELPHWKAWMFPSQKFAQMRHWWTWMFPSQQFPDMLLWIAWIKHYWNHFLAFYLVPEDSFVDLCPGFCFSANQVSSSTAYRWLFLIHRRQLWECSNLEHNY